MLSRVFSRTKLVVLNSSQKEMDRTQNAIPQVFNPYSPDTSAEQTCPTTPPPQRSIISEVKQLQGASTSRKHSYASVREDSELPQSFRSRSLLRDSLASSRRQSTEFSRGSADVQGDSFAVFDDELVELHAIPADLEDDTTEESVRHISAFEALPDEILDQIFSLATLDTSQDPYANPRVTLYSCLFVSRSVHAAALRVLYQDISIPQSKTFFKFVNSISADPGLGRLVRYLDLSHYSSIGFGKTKGASNSTPYLTPTTLTAALDRTPNLRAFLAHEHIDDELSSTVLSKLFKLPALEALDLCSCSSSNFIKAFTEASAIVPWPGYKSTIQRLSLHECTTLPSSVFETLLPRMYSLTHLDVAHTMINDKALFSIPTTAKITHLNLERCTQLTGLAVVKFLTTHPAVKDSLIYLNLMADASRHRLLSSEDLENLLPHLPSSLRSLNIGGARINSSHTPALRVLATHLEELGIKGANLSLAGDIALILSIKPSSEEKELNHPEWSSSIRYLDLTEINSVSQMSLNYSPIAITTPQTMPLEVIELSNVVRGEITKRSRNIKSPEWAVRELGRRGWYVRQPTALTLGQKSDDGYRPWKMGARWWGMRKIPMLEQEVSGMYGYFMFKRT